ncbi:class I SAM-dependent methyltransferase [Acidobacteriota bacterium]
MKKSRQRILIVLLIAVLLPQVNAGQNSYRDRELQPEKIMDTIGIKPGLIIGEGGAGSGYFTFKLANRIGPTGKIYANDISTRALSSIRSRCKKEGINNIETIMGEVENPLFPQGLDMIFMVAAFHDFEKPVKWLENAKTSMKPEATLVIVEKDPERYAQDSGHHMTKNEILDTVKKANFELVQVETFLDNDNIYIFRLKK